MFWGPHFLFEEGQVTTPQFKAPSFELSRWKEGTLCLLGIPGVNF